MTVKVRTKGFRFFMPVPVSMIGFIFKFIPDRVFEEMRINTPHPYDSLVTKEFIGLVLRDCLETIKENKGLEIVHVEAEDGTFVSIKI